MKNADQILKLLLAEHHHNREALTKLQEIVTELQAGRYGEIDERAMEMVAEQVTEMAQVLDRYDKELKVAEFPPHLQSS